MSKGAVKVKTRNLPSLDFGFASDWLIEWRPIDQSQSELKQNNFFSLTVFETQLKVAINLENG